MNWTLAHNDFIAAGCEAELYRYQQDSIIKLFYKKIPTEQIDFVYNKQLALRNVNAVCPMLDRGVEQTTGREYLVFDYIEGQSLAEISNQRSLSLFEAFRLVKKVTNIVVEMHEVGVVHGDIHGENVMMSEQGKVLLIDLFSKEKYIENDVVDICKLFHEVKYDNEPLPPEIKDLFPKKRDAVLRRYKDIQELQVKIIELTR